MPRNSAFWGRASGTGTVSSDLQRGGAIFGTVGCGSSMAIVYDGLKLPSSELPQTLLDIEGTLGYMRSIKLPSRHFKLPISSRHKKLDDTIDRYTSNQPLLASYLPDPLSYLAENNG
ncbi:hypothetical protein BDV06DRAFT_224698 [Aspergillus oleicola]